jgi:putative phosphoribosyl transferase
LFENRTEAGRRLGAALSDLGLSEPIVLALPRGGVPVGFEVASALDARLDVLVARKVGAPGHREFGIGAIAEGGVRVADAATLRMLRMGEAEFDRLAYAERTELERRVAGYRSGRPLPLVRGREVVVVDDGLATGVTAEAAVLAVRQLSPERVVLGVPVCSPDTARRLEAIADQVVCVIRAHNLVAVGNWYEEFDQTTDREVVDLLNRAGSRPSVSQP